MTTRPHSRILPKIFALLLLSIAPAAAQDEMRLKVTGAALQSEDVEISLEALDDMDQVAFKTTTIWTDGENQFSGVPLKALLERLGAEGNEVQMIALNDYAVSMPISELEDDAPIVATRINGETMSVREKGPFWVIYPFDRDARYSTETNYSRSIWQLNRLKVIN
ncbi:MAG: molybdopterin-dependent oxidoreductase [Sphingorhabdus sp.]